MKIAGIIAEYNPFHNGHAWHIAQTRRLTGCDFVIVCMDGHFTQRGEPAPFSRWSRARMALSSGADAVFELPTLFAVRTADAFARGGVAILGGLGADALSFGCETDELGTLRALAALRENEPKSVSEAVKTNLGLGMCHARARGEALAAHFGLGSDFINRPNLILAVEYLRAIDALHLNMEAVAIRRQGNYHDGALGEFASAGAIRAAMARGETEAALDCIPAAARPFAAPEALHPMDDLLMDRLRRMSVEAMAALTDVSEGLEQRLHRQCRETAGREALLDAMKCRRYTRARLSRLLTHALLEISQDDVAAHPLPTCARLIGMRRGAQPLMRELKARSRLPVVSNPGEIREDPVFLIECRVTDTWALLHDEPALRLPGREFTEKFVIVE